MDYLGLGEGSNRVKKWLKSAQALQRKGPRGVQPSTILGGEDDFHKESPFSNVPPSLSRHSFAPIPLSDPAPGPRYRVRLGELYLV